MNIIAIKVLLFKTKSTTTDSSWQMILATLYFVSKFPYLLKGNYTGMWTSIVMVEDNSLALPS